MSSDPQKGAKGRGFAVEVMFRRRNGVSDSALLCRRKTKAAALRMAGRYRDLYKSEDRRVRVRHV